MIIFSAACRQNNVKLSVYILQTENIYNLYISQIYMNVFTVHIKGTRFRLNVGGEFSHQKVGGDGGVLIPKQDGRQADEDRLPLKTNRIHSKSM